MPIPRPSGKQTKEDFMSACMGSEVMNTEFPDQKQRAAVCFSKWKEHMKDKEAAKELEKEEENGTTS